MKLLLLLLIVCVVFLVLALKLKLKSGKSERYPYIRNKVLFSPAERSFLGVLEKAIDDEYRVFGKVRVADVAGVKRMSDRRVWQRAFNRISAKHFDFILCRKEDLTVISAIELNDKSHQQGRRKDRDEFMLGLCKAISLPLIQVQAQQAYSIADIRAKVMSTVSSVEIGPKLSATLQGFPEIDPRSDSLLEGTETPGTTSPVAESDGPVCPKCSSSMVRRKAKSGSNTGQEFWGCSTFPKCRGIIPVSDQQGAPTDVGDSRG